MSPDTNAAENDAESGAGDATPVDAKAIDAKGKVKEKLGWATGDREVEAKGRVEREEAAAATGRRDEESVPSVEDAEDEVRRANQELD